MPVTLVYVAGGLRPETRSAVLEQAPEAQLVELPAGENAAYPDWLRARWRGPGDWVLVEQDVVPPPDAIAGLFACAEGWCTHQEWNWGSYITTAFGLVKFSAALRQTYPDLMDRSLGYNRWQLPGPCLRPGEIDPSPANRPDLWPSDPNWFARDSLFAGQAHKRGLHEHVHQPPVLHLRDFSRPARTGEGKEAGIMKRIPRFNDLKA